jgi:predicted acylesterase/phospholipase RssA
VFVVARRGQGACLFRNYHDTDDAGAAGTDDACVWEAARATSAAPGFLEPAAIRGHQYMGGGVGHNNPVPDALAEVGRIGAWSGRRIACIVSLGTGIKTIRTLDQVVGDIPRLLADTAADCEDTH